MNNATRKRYTCRIYEVKHSDKIVEQQTRFLRMKELNSNT